MASLGEVGTNFGDKLNELLVERISHRDVISHREAMNLAARPMYSVIGSSLGIPSDRFATVWGTGFIAHDRVPKVAPRRICAVRGPLSREKFLAAGMHCPDVYGDPGLLISRFLPLDVPKSHKIGFIAQFRDLDLPIVQEIRALPDVKFIDIRDSIETVATAILSCELVITACHMMA